MFKKLLAYFVVPILMLLALEGISRIRSGPPVTEQDGFRLSAEFGWELKPGFKGDVYGATREFDAQGGLLVDTSQISDTSKSKIYVVGDSTAFGNSVPVDSTYAELLDRQLPDSDVINRSVPGYSSHQGAKLVINELLPSDPSLIIFSFNFNDRRYTLNAGNVDSDAKYLKLYYLRRISLVRDFAALQRRFRVGEPKYALDRLESRVSPDRYRANLMRVAGAARERGVPIVFLVLSDNPVHTEFLRRGIAFADSGDYDRAGVQLEIARQSGAMGEVNWFADLAALNLAAVYRKKGRDAAAPLEVTNPFNSLHGGFPIYLDSDYNEIMRDVARQYGMPVVEAGTLLDTLGDVYLDFCHLSEKGHQFVARSLFLQIQQMGL